MIRIVPAKEHSDTLVMDISGDSRKSDNASGTGWACSAILRKKKENSILPITVNSQGRGTASITNWKELDEMVMVITNGDPFSKRDITITFEMDTIPTGRDITIFPNPVSLRRQKGRVNFRGNDISDISIHTISGMLVWHYSTETENASGLISPGHYTWDCRTGAGSHIVPGTYMVLIVRKDQLSTTPVRTRHKLLIAP